MAYDEDLAERLREAFAARVAPNHMSERKMFGGLCLMVRGHMACGVVDSSLMARVGPDSYQASLEQAHVRDMDFTGRPMRGLVYVDPPGLRSEEELGAWVQRTLDFVGALPPKPGT